MNASNVKIGQKFIGHYYNEYFLQDSGEVLYSSDREDDNVVFVGFYKLQELQVKNNETVVVFLEPESILIDNLVFAPEVEP